MGAGEVSSANAGGSRKRRFHDVGIYALDNALQAGGERASLARVIVDAAGRCENPIGFENVYTRPVDDKFHDARLTANTLILGGFGRCRKCRTCLEFRRNVWTFRALQEVRDSQRTWFGTLTLCPAERTRILAEARERMMRFGADFDKEDGLEQFRRLCRQLGERLTRYIKRVRKASGARMRYLFVVERHRSGDPHLHCLLHECADSEPVRKALLEAQWEAHGYSAWRLIPLDDGKPCFYVCKYLSKEAHARVRASTRYGAPRGTAACVHTRRGETMTATHTPPENKKISAEGVMGTAHPVGG